MALSLAGTPSPPMGEKFIRIFPLVFLAEPGDGGKMAASLRVFGYSASPPARPTSSMTSWTGRNADTRKRNRPNRLRRPALAAAFGELSFLVAALTALLLKQSPPVILVILAILF